MCYTRKTISQDVYNNAEDVFFCFERQVTAVEFLGIALLVLCNIDNVYVQILLFSLVFLDIHAGIHL